jgi:phosphoglycerol transferase MdoB-like AlkP superfamily enzyme
MPELNHLSEKDLGNEWGIFDEYLYSFIEEQLRTATKPLFFFVLTTSNHPPFEYPSSYQPRPLDLNSDFLSGLAVDENLARKRFTVLQYGNQKMAEFLGRINSSSLSENTIVALTGDHSYWITKGVDQDQEFKRYAVPFFLAIPKDYRPKKYDPNKFGSHEDIFPTLFNLALSNQTYIKLGEDLFTEPSFSMNSSGIIANEEGAYHNNKFWRWLDRDKQLLSPTEKTPNLERLRKKAEGLIALTDAYLKSEKSHKQTASKNDRQ